jgi:hypothetical protein
MSVEPGTRFALRLAGRAERSPRVRPSPLGLLGHVPLLGLLVILLLGLLISLLILAACARPAPPPGEVAVRGHHDAVLAADGRLTPLFLDPRRAIGLCLAPPPEVDSSQWTARLTAGGAPLGGGRSLAPKVRMETTVCFEAPPPQPFPEQPVDLCAAVRDEVDGRSFGPVCRRVRFGKGAAERKALADEAMAMFAARGPRLLAAWLGDLDALVLRIERRGYPFYAAQLALVGVSECQREATPPALREARRRLAALPRWLAQPAAAELAGQAAYEAASLELADGLHLERAWSELRRAETLYRRIAHRFRITVRMRQAEILALVGATDEGTERLRAALADCGRSPCDELLLPSAYGELAWLILSDPDASDAALEEARGLLEKALANPQMAQDRLERANRLVDLAYLEARERRDPAARLAVARALLAPSAGGWEGFLYGWTDLVEGTAALAAGDAARALALCGRRAAEVQTPRLAARALACAGAAYRREGERERALWSYEQAILLHEVASPAQLGQRLPLGPGQRADDYYEAARLAVDLGEPARAWELLERLDRLAAGEEVERRCREATRDPALARRWQETERERDRLLARVLALDMPASGARRRQLETVRRGLKEQLQELSRRSLGCAGAPEPAGDALPAEPLQSGDLQGGPLPAGQLPTGRLPASRLATGDLATGYRAFPLADEVLLLRRDAAGQVTLERRTPFERRELRREVAAMSAALDQRSLSDEAWRQLAAPVAAALVPRLPKGGERRDAVVLYALHGPLQAVPPAALPLPESGNGGADARWLSDLATPGVLPAGLGSAADPAPAAVDLTAAPLFVVDPRGDLPGGGSLARDYAREFPGATVLRGGAAGRAAFQQGLTRATLLHLDTHGSYDPAFPELSSLLLADGPLTLAELAELPTPRGLVNLSGCRTGAWPITADSGQFGLAGLFARRRTVWVVASRSDLDDGVARDFNRAFYGELAAGRGAAASYGRALAEVRRHHPAAAWGGLLLLRGSGPPEDGGHRAVP